jgi:rhamnose transport system permease protein
MENEQMSNAIKTSPRSASTGQTSLFGELWKRVNKRDLFLLLVLFAVIAYNSATIPNFSSTTTVGYLLIDVIPILLLALTTALIIISAEIDLSIASIVGLSAATIGVMVQRGDSMILAAFAALLVGLVAGAFNGFLVAYVGLPSLAATIGTLALYRGLALVVIGDVSVGNFPEEWTSFVQGRSDLTGIPYVMPIVGVFIIWSILVLHFSAFGRGLFALGYSKEAAKFVGVNVERTKFILFVASGAVASLVGLYWALRYGSARSDSAAGLELTVIAAVLLGGVSIFGGRGTIPGVVVSVMLIAVVTYGFRLQRISDVILVIITGLLLIASVVGPNLYQKIREKLNSNSQNKKASST